MRETISFIRGGKSGEARDTIFETFHLRARPTCLIEFKDIIKSLENLKEGSF